MKKKPEDELVNFHDWDVRAYEALEEARKLPQGPERSEALKKAGLLRVAADMKGQLLTKLGTPQK
jgi:hypothetical protein